MIRSQGRSGYRRATSSKSQGLTDIAATNRDARETTSRTEGSRRDYQQSRENERINFCSMRATSYGKRNEKNKKHRKKDLLLF
jgi:hypothetical protein